MSERASIQEVLEFANKVREAGGANPLDALMPAVPAQPHACLIAKNLNFNCSVYGVDGHYDSDGNPMWAMWFTPEDREIRDRIADSLDLPRVSESSWNGAPLKEGVVLPERIGNVAQTFDNVWDAVRSKLNDPDEDVAKIAKDYGVSVEDIEAIYPLIEQSQKEAYGLAADIDEDGRIL